MRVTCPVSSGDRSLRCWDGPEPCLYWVVVNRMKEGIVLPRLPLYLMIASTLIYNTTQGRPELLLGYSAGTAAPRQKLCEVQPWAVWST